MKKLIRVLALTVACCAAATAFVGCADKKTASGSPDSLVFDTKYYYMTDIHNNKNGEAEYYIFYADGTCMSYSQSGSTYIGEYTKQVEYRTYYKYTYVDEQKTGIMCFFDSKSNTYFNNDGSVDRVDTTPTSNQQKQYQIFSISKNILINAGAYGTYYYINENYVDEIPNFYPAKDD